MFSSNDFQISTNSVSGFGLTLNLTFPGNTINQVIYVKHVAYNPTTPFIQGSISFVDVNSVNATAISVTGIKILTTTGAPAYKLQLLHASDFEAGLAAMDNAPKFAAIWSQFNGEYANTLRVSGGDNFLPSPFFNAAADGGLRNTFANINNGFLGGTNGANYREGIGRGDIQLMNMLDLHASAVGNHEFDAGTGTFAEMISVAFNDNNAPTQIRWAGTRFPYLSSNLDFSADANLSGLYTNEIRPSISYKIGPTPNEILALTANQRRKIAPATVVTIGGEVIGIVGATTQIVSKISSTGAVSVMGTNIDDMPLLATQVQTQVDRLRGMGINKIVLLSHLQQIANEKALAPLLSGVDIIVAAGSHTLMADADDNTEGDTKVENYPFEATDKDGAKTLIVSTESEYKYVGRLVVDFDASGNIIPSSVVTSISGAWKSTDAGMVRANVNTVTAFAGTTSAYLTRGLIEGITVSPSQPNAITLSGVIATLVGIRGIINSQDGNIFGKTQVFMEGRREGVCQQETNLGNVSSDANLWYARNLGYNVQVSIKNGGGIRASLGVVSAVGSNFVNLPPLANPSAGKLSGEISQLDIANALRFNNGLSVITVTAAQLLQTMNHAVAASTATATPGQFPQIGGMQFSFDIAQPAGSRVRSLAIVDSIGNVIDVIAENGSLVGDNLRTIGMVTLNFLVTGGDNYPFPSFQTSNPTLFNRNNLYAGNPSSFLFTDAGSEQQAFARYLQAAYPRTSAGYNIIDTPESTDRRIQNLSKRTEMILPDFSMPIATFTGKVNEVVSLSNISISGTKLATSIHIHAPAGVSVEGMSMKTVSGMGGLVTVSAKLPAAASGGSVVLTLTSASLTKTFTHYFIANQLTTEATFVGASLSVGGVVNLSSLLTTNSDGAVTYAVASSGVASVSGTSLTGVAGGIVTVTGSIAPSAMYTAASFEAVFTVVSDVVDCPIVEYFDTDTLSIGDKIIINEVDGSTITGWVSSDSLIASVKVDTISTVAKGIVTITGTISGVCPKTYTLVVNVIELSAVKSAVAPLTIHPNPVSAGVVYFSTPISESIYATQGNKVLSFTRSASANVSVLQSGVYILKTSENGIYKLIIE